VGPSARTDDRTYEAAAVNAGFARVAGVDEAGRGPLAGPVVAAAAILPLDFSVTGVTDSKRLTPRKRSALYDDIYRAAISIGIGIVDPPEIDRINILQASLTAMAIAVDNLDPFPDCLLIDGNFPIAPGIFSKPPVQLKQQSIVGGDSKSVSIAAASIVAKVTRDRIMAGYHLDYPEFGFPGHKGYATKAHLAAISQFGCCPIHRRSFRKGAADSLRQQALFAEEA